jgi:hypothetical protein
MATTAPHRRYDNNQKVGRKCKALSILYLIKFINDLQSLIKFVMLFTTSTQQIRKISTHIADNSDLKDIFSCFKKSLKIPKGQSESVYLRRTENTMAKRKSTKGQTMINKTYIES